MSIYNKISSVRTAIQSALGHYVKTDWSIAGTDGRVFTPDGSAVPQADPKHPPYIDEGRVGADSVDSGHDPASFRSRRMHSVAAHGFFECYDFLADFTVSPLFSEAGKKTPVCARFSAETVGLAPDEPMRVARGFSVRFIGQAAWDLVGLNIPVFFIQDAMRFPAFMHALKPSCRGKMPGVRDRFWDFVSLMPESAHTLMWLMSDHGIPRSYRMMQGFGLQVFRLVDAQGESRLAKFQWSPMLGTHSYAWDEAVKVCDACPDYYWRDMWEAIESGNHPQWELGVQIFTEQQAARFSFDVLDATKLIPEELVPLVPVGRMVLNRNSDAFLSEAAQVGFCTAQAISGIEPVNDPLFVRLVHSYVDSPVPEPEPAFDFDAAGGVSGEPGRKERDGAMGAPAGQRGRTAWGSGALASQSSFLSGIEQLLPYLEPATENKLWDGSPRPSEHYNQARLFYDSQTGVEMKHIIDACVLELSQVALPVVRYRTVAMLRNISEELARTVAKRLGMSVPEPLPVPPEQKIRPEVLVSPSLSLTARPGGEGARACKVAILVADGIDGSCVSAIASALVEAGAAVRLVGPHIGPFIGADRFFEQADATLDRHPSALFDGVVVPDGAQGVAALCDDDRAVEFVRDQYRHGKSLLLLGAGLRVLRAAHISPESGAAGLVVARTAARGESAFIESLGRHRHPERDMGSLACSPPPGERH